MQNISFCKNIKYKGIFLLKNMHSTYTNTGERAPGESSLGRDSSTPPRWLTPVIRLEKGVILLSNIGFFGPEGAKMKAFTSTVRSKKL